MMISFEKLPQNFSFNLTFARYEKNSFLKNIGVLIVMVIILNVAIGVLIVLYILSKKHKM